MPIWVVPSKTLTTLLASAVPFNKKALVPVGAEDAITGAVGAAVSIVTANAAEAALVVEPAVAVVVKLCAPSARAAVVNDQAPLLLAVAVPTCFAPS